MNENPRKKIYDTVSAQGLYTKSYDEFQSQYDSPEAINDLYSVLRQKELYTKELPDFVNKYYSDKYTYANGAIKPLVSTTQKKSLVETGGSASKVSGSTASAPTVALDSEIDLDRKSVG